MSADPREELLGRLSRAELELLRRIEERPEREQPLERAAQASSPEHGGT